MVILPSGFVSDTVESGTDYQRTICLLIFSLNNKIYDMAGGYSSLFLDEWH